MTSSAHTLPERTEVAIVGAGPTGLALAVTLALAGADFVLLDQQEEGPTPPAPRWCTLAPSKCSTNSARPGT